MPERDADNTGEIVGTKAVGAAAVAWVKDLERKRRPPADTRFAGARADLFSSPRMIEVRACLRSCSIECLGELMHRVPRGSSCSGHSKSHNEWKDGDSLFHTVPGVLGGQQRQLVSH
jgi:hypothetical protein